MKKIIFLAIATFLLEATIMAQTKVAAYSFGKPGTDKYEHLSFWTKDGKRTEIYYAYGKNGKEIKLQYLEKDPANDTSCFKVRFTNNYILYVIPKELKLQLTDASGKYNKTFSWEYEGPVNGIGTFCNVCAEDEEDAMNLIKSSYLK